MFVLIDPDDNLLRCIDNLYQARSATTSRVASVPCAPAPAPGALRPHCVGKLRLSEMFQQIKDHGQQHKGSPAKAAAARVEFCEADEQSGPDRSGAGGAKGGGQGEREPAKQAPDTGTGSVRLNPGKAEEM